MMALAGCEADGNEENDGFGGSAPKHRDLLHGRINWKINDLDNTDATYSVDDDFDLA